jgi:hypothetical protein
LLDLAAIDPDVEPSANQPTPSLAVHVSDVLPLFVSVMVALVAVLPKSTFSGETENVVVEVDATVIVTGTFADPAVPAEKLTLVE